MKYLGSVISSINYRKKSIQILSYTYYVLKSDTYLILYLGTRSDCQLKIAEEAVVLVLGHVYQNTPLDLSIVYVYLRIYI